MMTTTYTRNLGAPQPAAAAASYFGRQLGVFDAGTALVWRCSG